MIILGIDPGLRVTGFGLVDHSEGRMRYVSSGIIRVPAEDALSERLKAIFSGLTEIIERHSPEEASIEKVFVNVNPQSTLLLGQARGAALCAAAMQNLSATEYTALQIKQAVVGHGHADKHQVQDMIQRVLGLPAPPKTDAADALACAICHAFHRANPMFTSSRRYRLRGGRLIR